MSYSCIGRLSIVSMKFFLKLIYKFTIIPIKIIVEILEISISEPKMYMETQGN